MNGNSMSLCTHCPDGPTVPASVRLSPRERQVLALLWDGQQIKEIAETLGLSPKWVKHIRQRLGNKFDVKTTMQLVRAALRQGLLWV